MIKFAASTLATLLFVASDGRMTDAVTSFSSSSSFIRGSVKKNAESQQATTGGWSLHPNDTRRRRLALPHDNECLLLLKDIQYEDHTIENDCWVCEFNHTQAALEFNSREFMDIDIPKSVIDEMHPTSGESVLITRGAYIEESMDTKEMKLRIPVNAEMKVVTLHETDPRHYKQRRMNRRRQLADSNPGEYSVLVLRVVDSTGAKVSGTDAQIVDDIFTDQFSLKTGYEQCSKDQFILQPATGQGINNGIYTVNIDIAASNGQGALQQEAFAQATNDLGSLSGQWDLVMFCQPPGSGSWLAYAYINSWASFYNDYWCLRVSAQMHEVGHNLGLGHSNQGATAYGDQSSMMGYSYNSDDGPKMCFNAAKNFQLGWYELQKESFYPLQVPKNEPVPFILNGINDYKKDGSASNGELVTLRIAEYGDEYDSNLFNYGKDYYVGYNRATGPNTGTLEGKNQVLIFRKDLGGPDAYGESNRVADLNVGDSYTIPNYRNEGFDVQIRWKSLTNNGKDANIEITTIGEEFTVSPTNSPTTKTPTDVPVEPTDAPMAPTSAPVSPTESPTTKTPTEAPLAPTSAPVSPTNSPTQPPVSPTPAPVQPTAPPIKPSCTDSKDVVFKSKGKSKKCSWVKKGKIKKIRKKCSRKYKGVLVEDACAKTCGMYAGMGPCKFLFKE